MNATIPKRVLVTGATGFIGSRLIEVLHLAGQCTPRALVHSTAGAWRITRYPVEFAVGDLTNSESVDEAVKGCDAVVHLAIGGDEVSGKGTENMLQAAAKAGVSRFVHMSSVAIFGNTPPPAAATEECPTHPTSLPYGNQKLAQERLVLKWGKNAGLPVVVLRPPNVTGPFSPFTLGLLQKIKSGTVPMVNDGQNPCNLVYIDNLIQAILLSLWKPEASGQAFFVTNPDVVTWRQCLLDHAKLVGATVPEVQQPELVQGEQPRFGDSLRALPRVLFSGELRSVLRQIPAVSRYEGIAYSRFQSLPEQTRQRFRLMLAGPTKVPVMCRTKRFSAEDGLTGAQNRSVVHSCGKAQRLLGYTAPVTYHEGMGITEAWLRFAKVI